MGGLIPAMIKSHEFQSVSSPDVMQAVRTYVHKKVSPGLGIFDVLWDRLAVMYRQCCAYALQVFS